MKRWLLSLALCAGILGGMAAVAATAYNEGVEYQRVTPPQPTQNPDKIEVVELFWFGCPHCFHLEPYLNKWLETKPDNVEFVRLPAILGPSWELFARAFFTAELLGVSEQIHKPLFERIHSKRDRKVFTEDGLADFFTEFGVDKDKFSSTLHSFAVAAKLNHARLMTQRYGITGVPTLVVDGKYRTGAGIAGGNEGLISVLNFLITQQQAEKSVPVADAQP